MIRLFAPFLALAGVAFAAGLYLGFWWANSLQAGAFR